LTLQGLKGKQGVELPEEVVKATEKKYLDIAEILMGSRESEGSNP
jgi:hypothetical protein